MLWTIIGVLLVLWLLGLVANVGGALIHVLLVLAVVAFLYNMVTRRSSV